MRTADNVWRLLKDFGIKVVFFVPGGGSMFLNDALIDSGLTAVSCIHEQGAGFAALGYAQYAKAIGVCLTTSGPGATNAITPCAAAWTDSQPVLFISGQTDSKLGIGESGLRTKGVQEIDIVPMVKPITKYAYQSQGHYTTINALEKMISLCKQQRPGPCWLSIPLDVQAEECNQ
jgi:acetolactate synthase I/II/III large subunit